MDAFTDLKAGDLQRLREWVVSFRYTQISAYSSEYGIYCYGDAYTVRIVELVASGIFMVIRGEESYTK